MIMFVCVTVCELRCIHTCVCVCVRERVCVCMPVICNNVCIICSLLSLLGHSQKAAAPF